MATLSEIITSARELSFDRFVTPCFFIQGNTGDKMYITATNLVVKDISNAEVFSFDMTDKKLQDLVNELIVSPRRFKVSYSASFISNEPASSLIPISGLAIDMPVPIYRKYFFSDDYVIKELVRDYFIIQLGMDCGCDGKIQYEQVVAKMQCPRDRHLALWLAFYLLEKRRLFELSATTLGQSTFSNGSGDIGLVTAASGTSSLTMSIGDVFSLSDNPSGGSSLDEGFNRPGADNIFGDKDSFWYRNQCYVREMFERLFGDFSLRPNQVMFGTIELEKDLNYYAYFDSYPYTISPFTRGILSRGH